MANGDGTVLLPDASAVPLAPTGYYPPVQLDTGAAPPVLPPTGPAPTTTQDVTSGTIPSVPSPTPAQAMLPPTGPVPTTTQQPTGPYGSAIQDPLGPMRWYQKLARGFQEGWNYQPGMQRPIVGINGDVDPNTGQPVQPMSKLGKLFAILHGAAMGAAAGSTQPTWGTGMMAAQNYMDQQQNQAIQQAQARQNLAFMPLQLQYRQQQMQQQLAESKARQAYLEAGTSKREEVPLAQQYSDAVSKAVSAGRDPQQDPDVQRIGDAIQWVQKQSPAKTPSLQQLYEDKVSKAVAEGRDPLQDQDVQRVGDAIRSIQKEPSASNAQQESEFLRIETKKASGQALTQQEAAFDRAYRTMKTITPAFNMQMQASGGGMGPGAGGGGGAAPANAPGGWVTDSGQTLNNVPANIRGLVQQVLEYRHADYPISYRNPTTTAINQWVSQLDKQHDAVTFPARNKILREFETDANTGELGGINTALGHLGDLYQASQALNQNDIPLLHSIASRWGVATGGTAETVYNGILHRVAPELTKAYLKSGGTEGERGSNEGDFALSQGQAQIQNNIFEAANLLNSKLASKRNDWEKNFLPYRDQDHFDARWITPDASQTLATLGSRSPVAPRGGRGTVKGAPQGGKAGLTGKAAQFASAPIPGTR